MQCQYCIISTFSSSMKNKFQPQRTWGKYRLYSSNTHRCIMGKIEMNILTCSIISINPRTTRPGLRFTSNVLIFSCLVSPATGTVGFPLKPQGSGIHSLKTSGKYITSPSFSSNKIHIFSQLLSLTLDKSSFPS